MENTDLEKVTNSDSDIVPVKDSSLDKEIDESLLTLPLDAAEKKLIGRIIEAPSKADLQKQFELFNITQSKKNALRVIKLNSLLEKVEDQAIERFEKRPDQVSNKELLEYMNVVSSQIDRAQKSVTDLSAEPTIHMVNNQKNEVNINVGPQLDRDSKERVMDAISALLKQVQTAAKDTIVEDNNKQDLSEDITVTVVDTKDFDTEKEERSE